jgi:hypothetical protein
MTGGRMVPHQFLRRELALALLIGLTCGVAGSGVAQQVPLVGHAAEVHGEVLVTSHGDMAPKSLSRGDQLFEGDQIETGEESRARLVLEDGSLVQVGGRSAVVLEWVLYAPALDSRNVILSADGVVRLIVEALVPRSSFEVKTHSAIASAEHADWIVAAGPKGTWVIALEGEVSVENVRPDVVGTILLVGDDRTRVRPGKPPAKVKPLAGEQRDALLRRTEIR